jgi:thiol-disulfide isomerase/thioredoxin
MKTVFLICYFFICSFASAQATYEIFKDSTGAIVYKGLIPVTDLEKETAFTWIRQDLSGYKPDSSCVAMLNKAKDSIYLLVFAGTWCSDTQIILPQLLHLIKKAGFPLSQLNIFGADRKKKTSGTIAESLGIRFVPTIIVFKKGKECGRVVEYGKYGQFDKELAEILSQSMPQ